jgi:hypothetical protein
MDSSIVVKQKVMLYTVQLDDKILRTYVRQYIDDIFVEFGEQPSVHLILILVNIFSIFFNILQYINKCYTNDGKI